MKRLAILMLSVILWASGGWSGTALETAKVTDVSIRAYFSPNGGCTTARLMTPGEGSIRANQLAGSLGSRPYILAVTPGAVPLVYGGLAVGAYLDRRHGLKAGDDDKIEYSGARQTFFGGLAVGCGMIALALWFSGR